MTKNVKIKQPPSPAASQCERDAKSLGSSESQLRRHLRRLLAGMDVRTQQAFGEAKFRFKTKSLSSEDGTKALVWKIRAFPNRPIGPGNEQHSRGVVHYDAGGSLHQLQIEDGRLYLVPVPLP